MKLRDIIQGCGVIKVTGNELTEVAGITRDSRAVQPGSLFIAVKGFESDGHAYIGKALEAGAAAIVYEDEAAVSKYIDNKAGEGERGSENEEKNCGKAGNVKGEKAGTEVAWVQVKDSRWATAIIAANFYDNPSAKLNLVGVTGTNGKTTIVTLLYRLFTSLGYSCGLLSTISNYVGARSFEAVNTTSDPITINSLLAEMVDAGCEYCFMEVSSIGIVQDRVEGLRFRLGIFTNLTHDHLDYHKTFAEYLRCKKLFFDRLSADASAIINVDDRNGEIMVQNTKAKIVRYSCGRAADHSTRIMERSFEGMLLKIDGREVWTSLIGQHNAYNVLAVYCAAMELGADVEETLVAVSRLQSATGRLETINAANDVCIVIDYAHTPDALENVLKTLREIAPDRTLVCLFGCGGDRDRSKRPEMGELAGKMADRIIVTSDNSRTERTADIMEDIRGGMDTAARAKALFIEDREQAIRTAILTAQPGTTILLAGKGHETYQILGTEKRHFDEREVVAKILAESGLELNKVQSVEDSGIVS